jgi:hypothetical protein
MNAPVVGSPVMDELSRQGRERCFDRSALLGYSSYYSDNDSDHSVQRKNGRADRQVRGRMLRLVSLIFDMRWHVLACTGGDKSLSLIKGEPGENLCPAIRRKMVFRISSVQITIALRSQEIQR